MLDFITTFIFVSKVRIYLDLCFSLLLPKLSQNKTLKKGYSSDMIKDTFLFFVSQFILQLHHLRSWKEKILEYGKMRVIGQQ